MRDAVRRLRGWWPWLLVVGALGGVYGRTLSAHIRRGFDPHTFVDDARQQIYPFFRYADSSLFPNDYIADYYLDCLPVGFRAIYTVSAPLIDPITSSMVLTYLLLLTTVAGLGVAANRLGGKVAAWGAMALLLGASIYMDRIGGGLPRAFGFPILAWALAALSYGRTKWLAVLTWLGACFYPVAGLILGMTTALLLLLPARDRGDASDWGVARRVRFLALVGGVSVLLLLPTIAASSKYAPVLSVDDIGEYPEAGPGGRYSPNSRAPYHGFFRSASSAIRSGVIGTGKAWVEPIRQWVNTGKQPRGYRPNRQQAILDFVAMFTMVGWVLFVGVSSAARRVAMLGLAAFIGYCVARFVAPYFYLPNRYTTYPVPLLAVLMVSTSVAGFFAAGDRLRSTTSEVVPRPNRAKEWLASLDPRGTQSAQHLLSPASFRAGSTFVFCLFVLLTVGGRGRPDERLYRDARNAPLYEAITQLPVDAVIAGWPRTAIESVPYFSRRAALLTFETHQAFHGQYVKVMRGRMRALIDATLATSNDPLIHLRDEHGVTHMLVYLPHLQGGKLTYFKPFDAWIKSAQRLRPDKPLVLQGLVDDHAVYRSRNYAIIDLRELKEPT